MPHKFTDQQIYPLSTIQVRGCGCPWLPLIGDRCQVWAVLVPPLHYIDSKRYSDPALNVRSREKIVCAAQFDCQDPATKYHDNNTNQWATLRNVEHKVQEWAKVQTFPATQLHLSRSASPTTQSVIWSEMHSVHPPIPLNWMHLCGSSLRTYCRCRSQSSNTTTNTIRH